eukprot:10425133-Lingulodinium_polyedra.AAC.1
MAPLKRNVLVNGRREELLQDLLAAVEQRESRRVIRHVLRCELCVLPEELPDVGVKAWHARDEMRPRFTIVELLPLREEQMPPLVVLN